ncbi:MAG TPA: nitroreductase family protein [Solirubrobacteraceae bacterium]|jgi:nitroreductase
MELFDCMRNAPTTRRFSAEPVSRETLLDVLEHARFAPSGGNRQGWRVIAVTQAERRRALRDLYLPHWRAYLEQTGGARMLAEPEGFDPVRVRMLKRADEYANHLDKVPLHLVVGVRIADLAITDAELDRLSIVGGASVYPFVQNILLGLRAHGLGAALTTLLVPAEKQVKELLGIPDDIALAAYIGVGHRAEAWPERLSRNPPQQFAFAERWGEPLASD